MAVTVRPINVLLAFGLGSALCVLYFAFVHETYAIPAYNNIKESYSTPLATGDISQVREILASVPDATASFDYTDPEESSSRSNLITLGSAARFVTHDDTKIIDVRHGQVLQGELDSNSFNLAVLKLPMGSKWGFLGVSRGPAKKRDFLQIVKHTAMEQILVAFGLNITSDGQLIVVSDTYTLDLPEGPNENCKATGYWAWCFGPEDPRLFWTDAGTPALTYGMNSAEPGQCRGMGFLPDMRRVFEPLKGALAIAEGVARYDPTLDPPATMSWEMRREGWNGWIEKNWGAFYPGPIPSGDLVPHIHYSITPDLRLSPARRTSRTISYESVDKTKNQAKYFETFHPKGGGHFHQATPLYRLTFCERGCKPTADNTLYISLSQVRTTQRYAKFVWTSKVTSPFELVSIGPLFNINGLDDYTTINYVLALTPMQKSDLHPSIKPKSTSHDYLPGHFFIDDDVLLTMGHEDESMVSAIIPVRDLITRHRLVEEAATLDA